MDANHSVLLDFPWYLPFDRLTIIYFSIPAYTKRDCEKGTILGTTWIIEPLNSRLCLFSFTPTFLFPAGVKDFLRMLRAVLRKLDR